MFDFHDHLNHDFAYVATGEFKAGRFEEAQQLYASFSHDTKEPSVQVEQLWAA